MFSAIPFTLVLVLQYVLYGQCQSSGPPITPPTLSLPTAGSTTSSGGSSTTSSSGSSSSSNSPTTTSSAQFPSLSGYSACVSNCLALSVAAANCTSVVEVNCFCVSPRFPRELESCVTSQCSQDELPSAENLAQQFCNLASSSPSLSFPTISSISTSSGTTTTTTTASATTETSPSQSTASSAAAPPAVRFFDSTSTPLIGCLITAILAVFSGILVL